MNLHQLESFLAKARRWPAFAGRPVKRVRGAKTEDLNKCNASKKAAFLRAFGKNQSIAMAARLVGIDRTTHYEWFAKDAKYKAAFARKIEIVAGEKKEELARLGSLGGFTPSIL